MNTVVVVVVLLLLFLLLSLTSHQSQLAVVTECETPLEREERRGERRRENYSHLRLLQNFFPGGAALAAQLDWSAVADKKDGDKEDRRAESMMEWTRSFLPDGMYE